MYQISKQMFLKRRQIADRYMRICSSQLTIIEHKLNHMGSHSTFIKWLFTKGEKKSIEKGKQEGNLQTLLGEGDFLFGPNLHVAKTLRQQNFQNLFLFFNRLIYIYHEFESFSLPINDLAGHSSLAHLHAYVAQVASNIKPGHLYLLST